jgi:uncharacterized protein
MKNAGAVKTWSRKYFFGVVWFFVSLFALNYHQSLIFPSDFISTLYFITTFIGHYGMLITVTYFLTIKPLLVFFPRYRVLKFISIVLTLFFLILILIDSMIFAQYRYHLNGFILELLFGGAAGDIFDFPLISYLLVFGGAIIFTFFLNAASNRLWEISRLSTSKNSSWYFYVVLACLILSHGIHIYGSAMAVRPITRLAEVFPIHFPATATKFLKKRGLVPMQNSQLKIDKGSNDFHYPKEEIKCASSERNKNILLIVIDSWRFDEMDEVVTPHIYQLGKEGMIFKNHFSGSNNTRGGIFSIFYAMPATYWEITLNTQTPPVLMNELQARKYELGIFAAASLVSPEFDRTVFAKVPNLRISTPGENSVEKDLQITKEWKAFLNKHVEYKNPQPFFGFLFYDSPHSYAFPSSYKKEFNPIAGQMNYLALTNYTDSLPYLNLHKKSVSFVDTLVAEVLGHLKEKKLLDDTIVIITGDHGQELNDNKKNFWGHNSNYSFFQTKVPMVVLWPKTKQGEVNSLTNHYDLAPTLMSREFNCSTPFEAYSYGEDFMAHKERDWMIVSSYIDFGILDFKKSQILSINPLGEYSVTDLNLNDIDKNQANEALLLNVFKNLNRFKMK